MIWIGKILLTGVKNMYALLMCILELFGTVIPKVMENVVYGSTALLLLEQLPCIISCLKV